MKRVLILAGLAAMALCGCVERGARNPSPGPILSVHWTGAAALSARPEGPTNLQRTLALPATIELRNALFGKLSRTELWNKGLPPDAGNASGLLRPLLEDLWNNESILELRGESARPDVIVGVQGDPKRAELWSTNLWRVAHTWKLGTPVATSSNAWSAKATGSPAAAALHYATSGKWILAALSHSGKNPLEAMTKSDAISGLESALVDFRADGPRLNECWPVLAKYPLPPVEMKVTARGQLLRTEGKLMYSERLPIKLESWRMPTNLIFEPLISFTCVRGIAPLWNQSKGFSKLRLQDPPNQFTMWGLGTVHVQTFFTVPMPNATNAVKELAPRLPELVYAYFSTNAPANFIWISNRAEWIWGGLPMIVPHLHPEKTPDGEVLFGGLFPMGPRTNPAPAELFAQIRSRTNLVYYDWELSQERLFHARHAFQLLDIISGRQLSVFSSPSQRWLTNLPPCLGNTITEVTLTSPKELSFVRKSDLGFTGFELAWLARWFDSPDFPIQYQPPPAHRLLLTNRPSVSATNRPAAPRTNSPPGPATNAPPARKQ
jgi:hypothetical protein